MCISVMCVCVCVVSPYTAVSLTHPLLPKWCWPVFDLWVCVERDTGWNVPFMSHLRGDNNTQTSQEFLILETHKHTHTPPVAAKSSSFPNTPHVFWKTPSPMFQRDDSQHLNLKRVISYSKDFSVTTHEQAEHTLI